MTANKRTHFTVTVRGITLKIPKDVTDDIEVVELLGAIQDGDIFSFPKLARRMFGEEGYLKVKETLAGEDGRTRITDVFDFFTETFIACDALAAKN